MCATQYPPMLAAHDGNIDSMLLQAWS